MPDRKIKFACPDCLCLNNGNEIKITVYDISGH